MNGLSQKSNNGIISPPDAEAATPWPAVSMSAEDTAEVSRLAALPPIEYDWQGKAATKKLELITATVARSFAGKKAVVDK
jgi:hypothetical protein